MSPFNVVVDGSNLATEGRSLPNLTQLEEAVNAYQAEHPDATIIVVVDATFEHRIDPSERSRLKDAELHGEVVAPPAGTIGRGDVFILKIAERQDAVVLSNDSFQEFHEEFPWLFEPGRLVGGKPVTGVGWIFTERTPVRGPKKRSSGRGSKMPVKAAKKLAVSRPDGSAPKIGDVMTPAAPEAAETKVRAYDVAKELGLETKALQAMAKDLGITIASHASSLTHADAERLRAVKSEKKIRAYELAKELGVDTKELKTLAASANVELASHSSSISQASADKVRAAHERAGMLADVVASLEIEPERKAGSRSRRRKDEGKASPTDGERTAKKKGRETAAKKGDGAKRGAKGPRQPPEPSEKAKPQRSGSIPSNQPLDLVTFLAHHKVGSKVVGKVASFTSHGAMVDVELGEQREFHCYVRTVNLGSPPPQKARDVLTKGEEYKFKVAAIDGARRVAELELA
jgi:hypothetical protein